MNDDVFNLLGENGFVINSTRDFLRATEDVDLETLVQDLVALEKRANTPFDVKNFSRSLMESVENLDSIIKGDSFANLSDRANVLNYQTLIKTIKDRFNFVAEYIASEKNMQVQEENYFNVKRELNSIDFRTDLTPALKTRETLRLRSEEKICKDAYLEALNNFNTQKNIYDKEMQNFDLNTFKNSLLKDINDLGTVLQKLALNSDNKTKVEELVSEMRNSIAYYGLDKVKIKNEFEGLCNKYSLSFVGVENSLVKDSELQELYEEKDESYSETVDNSHGIFSPTEEVTKKEEPVKEPIFTKTKEGELNWLVNELKRLNPDATFELKEASDYKYDALINSDKEVNTLRLPSGFYYTSTSITNRYSAEENVLNVEFKTLEKEKTVEDTSVLEEPEVIEAPAVVDEVKPEDVLPTPPAIKLPEEMEKDHEETRPITDIFDDIDSAVNQKANDYVDANYEELSPVAPTIDDVVEEKIPVGKKLEVTKVRRAILTPTVKNILKIGGVVAVAGIVVGFGPGFLAADGIATVGGMIFAGYKAYVRGDNNTIPSLENEEKVTDINTLKSKFNDLFDGFKKKMSRKNNVEDTYEDDLDRQVQEVVSRGR